MAGGAGGMAGAAGGGGGTGGRDAGASGGSGAAGGAAMKAAVFFSGHELVDSPMPELLGAQASSLGGTLAWNYQIIGISPIRVRTRGNDPDGQTFPGYSLGKNRGGEGMNVVDELRTPGTLGAGERYDTLVVTERNDIVEVIMWERTVSYLRHFHDRAIEGNPRVATFLAQAWLPIDKAAPQAWIDHEKKLLLAWECAVSKVNLTLGAENRAERVAVLPAGAALVDLVERALADQVRGISGTPQARLDLIFLPDNVKLTRLGSYFIAAVHHAAVFRRSPVGASAEGIAAETAADLQRIAWDAVSAYRPRERGMDECRTTFASTMCASFYAFLKNDAKAADCVRTFNDLASPRNPFKWPDPGWAPLPPP